MDENDKHREGPAPGDGDGAPEEKPRIIVRDRRFWVKDGDEAEGRKPPRKSPYPSLLEELEERAKTSEEQLQKTVSAYRRTREETEGRQKRVERDFELRVQRATGEMIRDFLEVLDNLALAVQAGKDAEDVASLLEGVEMVQLHFLQILGRHGLEPVETVGRPFDPEHAEATGLVEVSDEAEDGVVLSEDQAGYVFRGELLRPARVRVGKYGAGGGGAAPPAGDAAGEAVDAAPEAVSVAPPAPEPDEPGPALSPMEIDFSDDTDILQSGRPGMEPEEEAAPEEPAGIEAEDEAAPEEPAGNEAEDEAKNETAAPAAGPSIDVNLEDLGIVEDDDDDASSALSPAEIDFDADLDNEDGDGDLDWDPSRG